MRIAVSNPDNIGDFVLRQPMIAAFLAEGHEVLLVVRDFVAPLAMELFPNASVLQCAGDPYGRDFSLTSALGEKLLRQFVAFDPEVFVVAAYQHTQLEELLAAARPMMECVGMNGYLYQARPETTTVSGIRFSTRVAVAKESLELEKNQLLCAAVLGRPVDAEPPQIAAAPEATREAGALLKGLGLAEGRFWAVCVGDAPDKHVRNWGSEEWSTLCRSLVEQHAARLLFIGSPAEHEGTMRVQQAMGQAGLRTATITDHPIELSVLIGVLDLAEGYIGKDTGPMHIAAALGKPVLSVFGGGDWPRFVPAATRGATLSVAVPCAGCGWACPLSRSHCVKDIPVQAVLEKAAALFNGSLQGFAVELLQPDPVLNAAILRDLLASVRIEQGKVAAERANFMQWHDDRMRDISTLKGELAAYAAEKEGEEQRARALADTQRRAQALEEQTNELRGRIEAQEERARRLEARAVELEFEARLATAQGRQATEERAVAERRVERLRQIAVRKIAESKSRAAAAQAEALQAKAELETLLAEVNALQATDWKSRLETALHEGAALRGQLEESTILTAKLRMELDTSDSRYQGLLADQEQLLRRKSIELSSALALIPDLRDELAALASDLTSRDERIAEWRARAEGAEGSVQETRRQLEETRAELSAVLEDHAARLVVIETLDGELKATQQRILAAEEERQEIERDRENRLRVIEQLSSELEQSERDRSERLRMIQDLAGRLAESETDREKRRQVILELSGQLAESESDREQRLHLIQSLSARLTESESDGAQRLELIQSLSDRLTESESDRARRLELIRSLSDRLTESESDRAQRLELIRALTNQLADSERDREERLRLINTLSESLATIETDRENRGHQIEQMHMHTNRLEQEITAIRNLLPYRILKQLHIL